MARTHFQKLHLLILACFATASLRAAPTPIVVNLNTDANLDSTYGGIYDTGTPLIDLRGAINQTNVAPLSDGYIITFDPSLSGATIAIAARLPILNLASANPLTIDGGVGGIIIDGGAGFFSGLFARQGTINLANMTIQNVSALGGLGGVGGGGGGMGAGAGLYVKDADVTLSNVLIQNATAIGGNGGGVNPNGNGGGGGLGGDGGNGSNNGAFYGGGGGLGGRGGDIGGIGVGSGGGGGINCGGTIHTGEGATEGGPGSEGGGVLNVSSDNGKAGNGTFTMGGIYSGGGGYSGLPPNQGAGGGGTFGFNAVGSAGGMGGFGGGGGGGSPAGDGGYGGGSGGSPGGNIGGFGGGGGGSATGGFGGGGGTFALGGIGGGAGAPGTISGQGGGGAGFGGGIFVDAGTLTLQGSSIVTGCSVMPGLSGATSGWSAGDSAFFLTGSTILLDPNGAQIVIDNPISDDGPDTFQGVTPGITVPSPPRAGVNIGIGSVSNLAGTVVFNSVGNTYFGGTTLNKGTLQFAADGSLGAPTAAVTFASNATLQFGASGNLNASRSLILNAGASGTIDTQGNQCTILGQITGSGGLVKKGTGGLGIRNASNNYTGSTTIQQGTLFIRNTGSIASSQSLNVLTGTIFNLSFATAPVTVQNVSGDPGSFIQLDTASLTCQITNSLTTVASTITDTGTGALIKTGAGTLELSSMSTYSGPTTVSQGVLFVSENGQIQSPVTVLSGGKLKGTGVILSDVIINGGGSIQAGGSIGDFSIDSLTLAGSSSILELDIDLTAGSSLSSRYLVSGPVALNGGTLQLNFVTSTGTATDHTYEFIEFVGGDPGVFGSITSVPGYTSEVIISPNLITLKLTVLPTPPPPPPTPSIGAGVSLSPNQRAVLSYLLAFQSVPALHSLFQGLAALSPDELRAALDSISPARNAASTFFSNQVAFDIEKISLSRLRDERILGRIGERKETKLSAALATKSETLLAMNSEAVISLPPVADDEEIRPAGRARTAAAKSDRMSFWTTGFGDFLSQDGQNSNPHIHDTASGAVLGFDYYGAKNGLFTISAGYLHNNITEGHHAGSGTSNGAVLSIYSTGYLGNGYLEAGALGGYNRFDMQRRVTYGGSTPFNKLAKSSFNNWVAVPHLGGGYDWMMKWGVVEPFASLDWAVSFQESYREKGASPLNMKSKSQTPNILRSQVGLNVYETWDNETSTFIFEQSGSYVNKSFFHTNMNSAIVIAPAAVPAGAPSSFTVQTYDKTLNLGSVGLELFYKHKRSGFFLSGNYQGEFGSSYMSNEVTGTLGVFF